MIRLNGPSSSKPVEINVGFCSLGVCRGSMAQEWVSHWSIPPSACTPSPETSALTHRNTCMSWSMENSQVRLKQCMRMYLWSQNIISWILTDAGCVDACPHFYHFTTAIIVYYSKILSKAFWTSDPSDLLLDFSRTLNLHIYPSGPMSLELSFSRSLVVETVNLSFLIQWKQSRIFIQGSW